MEALDINKYMQEYESTKDNPALLSDLATKFAADIFYFSTRVAQAELEEASVTVELLNTPMLEGDKLKRMSKTEAESHAIAKTLNSHGQGKANLEAAYELLNMFKIRIKALMNERSNT